MTEIVIENLEPPGEWLIIEILHAHKTAGDKLVVTNAPIELQEKIRQKTSNPPKMTTIPASQYCKNKKTIILDPDAPKPLTPQEATNTDCIIIGGILGDYPRRHRTQEITRKIPWAKTRNLGPKQLSIDGAVHLTTMILQGKQLHEIPLTENPTIKIKTPLGTAEITLPYAYPQQNGKPQIPPELKKYLAGTREL
jgi:ribosome biogenesis SPOUT family RNA methylase Rps3